MPSTDELLAAALASHRAGELAAAAARYRDVLAQEAGNTAALHMLGMLHHQRGETEKALEWFEKALAAAPGDASILANRAAVHLARADFAAAESDARQAIENDPAAFGAWINLGFALTRSSRDAEAAQAFRRASELRPGHAGAILQWFLAAAASGQPAGIANRLRTALPPLAAERSLALEAASRLEQAGQATAAAALLARLRAEIPADSEIAARLDIELRYRRACELEYLRRSDDAAAAARQVLLRAPLHRGSRLLLAELLRERGEIDAALEQYAQLVGAHPRDSVAASSRLIALQHASAVGAAELATAHRDWADRFAAASPRRVPAWPHADGERRLRVGWLSPRFSTGVVESFFAKAFEVMDRERMEHVLYDNGSVEDAVNARFHSAAAASRRVEDVDDIALCEQIEKDRIDVLVELSGHGPGNRLRALARRPATVQISWLDYFHSTGLAAIDFMLTDARSSPPEFASNYSERLLYLASGRLRYAPSIEYPPARERIGQPLRFACFNRLAKIGEIVLATWARILSANPDSVLRLKASALDDAQMRAGFLARCVAHGIDPSRLELTGYGTHRETLEAYGDVDIALDTHPFSGCATSSDALAMGVPVVTWPVATMASRQTASLLWQLGLSDCVANSAEEYAGCVQALVDDPDRRAMLRTALPARARATADDVAAHARELADAIRAGWTQWCTGALADDPR